MRLGIPTRVAILRHRVGACDVSWSGTPGTIGRLSTVESLDEPLQEPEALFTAAFWLGCEREAARMLRTLTGADGVSSGLGVRPRHRGRSDRRQHTDGVPGSTTATPHSTARSPARSAASTASRSRVRIMLGRFDARATPVAITGRSGTFRVTATQAAGPITVQARGFGSKTLDGIGLAEGRTTAARYRLRASVMQDPCPGLVTRCSTATTGGNPPSCLPSATRRTPFSAAFPLRSLSGAWQRLGLVLADGRRVPRLC